MADIKQKFKTPSGDNIIDKDFADFKENGGEIGGELKALSLKSKYLLDEEYLKLDIINWNSLFLEKNVGFYPTFNMKLGTTSNKWSELWTLGDSRTSNGYIKINNGMIIQWGTYVGSINAGGNEASQVTLPIRFPNAILSISTNLMAVDGSVTGIASDFTCRAVTNGLTGLQIILKHPQGYGTQSQLGWMAMGY